MEEAIEELTGGEQAAIHAEEIDDEICESEAQTGKSRLVSALLS